MFQCLMGYLMLGLVSDHLQATIAHDYHYTGSTPLPVFTS